MAVTVADYYTLKEQQGSNILKQYSNNEIFKFMHINTILRAANSMSM